MKYIIPISIEEVQDKLPLWMIDEPNNFHIPDRHENPEDGTGFNLIINPISSTECEVDCYQWELGELLNVLGID